MISRTLILFLTVFSLCAVAQASPDFTDRTPAYFVDRYGYSKSSKNVKEITAVVERRGAIKLKGQYSVREFRSGDLRVNATFALPSLKLILVKLSLPQKWTPEQINAALAAYGSGWKNGDGNYVIRSWVNPDGLKAISILNSLQIQSPIVVVKIRGELAKMDAKRKAVPKF